MTIRSRLLTLLLPTMLGFILAISCLFYLNWYHEIVTNFEVRLKSVALSAANLIDEDKEFSTTEAIKQRYEKGFQEIQRNLEISRIYLLIPSNNNEDHYRTISLSSNDSLTETLASYPLTQEERQTLFEKKESIILHRNNSSDRHTSMTALAPIVSLNGQVHSLVGADINSETLHQPTQKALKLITVSALAAAIILTLTLFFIANKISQPVQQLKNSALAIAAGNYGKSVQVTGPREIVELANTLNTMSECLEEQISRLEESALTRERMYGEYECTILLQQHMLQNVLESYSEPLFSFRTLNMLSEHLNGLLLQTRTESEKTLITLTAATKRGFKGIYELLSHCPPLTDSVTLVNAYPFLRLEIEHSTLKLSCLSHNFPLPLIWSSKKQGELEEEQDGGYLLEAGDFIFFYNHGFRQLFSSQASCYAWFSKVLRHFSAEGLDTCTAMFDRELLFFTRKRDIEEDIHLICMYINPPHHLA